MKIFVTRKIPKSGINLLEKHHTVTVSKKNRVLSKDEIIGQAKAADGLLCLLTDTIDAEVISSLPNLKMIANYAVGFNNVDVETATQKKIPVSNTPGVLTDTTAELAWRLCFQWPEGLWKVIRFAEKVSLKVGVQCLCLVKIFLKKPLVLLVQVGLGRLWL